MVVWVDGMNVLSWWTPTGEKPAVTKERPTSTCNTCHTRQFSGLEDGHTFMTQKLQSWMTTDGTELYCTAVHYITILMHTVVQDFTDTVLYSTVSYGAPGFSCGSPNPPAPTRGISTSHSPFPSSLLLSLAAAIIKQNHAGAMLHLSGPPGSFRDVEAFDHCCALFYLPFKTMTKNNYP